MRENSPTDIARDPAVDPAPDKNPPTSAQRVDVQAALTIVGRRPRGVQARGAEGRWVLDFRNANLTGYDLSGLNYDGAEFDNSSLNAATLNEASFSNCTFKSTRFCGAKIRHSCFRSSHFRDCNFADARIERSDFSHARFIQSDLRRARVIVCNLRAANLESAFGPYLEYALKYLKEKRDVSTFTADEIVITHRLFQNAICDDETAVSEATREALSMMKATPSPEIPSTIDEEGRG